MEQRQFHAQPAEGGGVFTDKKQNFSVPYFKKSQMDALYPAGGYAVVGSLGKGGEEIGTVTYENAEAAVYAVKKLPHTKVRGFVRVGEDTYLSVVQDVLLLWLLWILLALALLVGLAFLLKEVLPTGGTPETTNPPPGVIDENAILGEGEISVPEKIDTQGAMISVKNTPTIRLVAGQREQTHIFTNPEGNPCFFKIEIQMEADGEVLYTSDLLPPGYSISKFNLTRPLAAGEYAVVVHYRPTTFDKEQRPLNTLDFKTKLIVEEAAE